MENQKEIIIIFNEIWNQITFKPLKDSNLINFKNELLKEIKKIPLKNLQKPNYSLIAPAIHESQFYLYENELLPLFKNLIIATMNKQFNGLIQHSFCEILKGLNILDIKILKSFKETSPIIDIIFEETPYKADFLEIKLPIQFIKILSNFYFNKFVPESNLNPLAIENLERYGLIIIDNNIDLGDDKKYENYLSSETFLNWKYQYSEKNITGRITYLPGIITITNLGKIFRKVCCNFV